MTVSAAETLDEDTWEALAALLPQLSATAEPDRRVVSHVLSHEATRLLLARIGGRVVGALTVVIVPMVSGLRAHLDDVVVDEAERGRGIGEALVRAGVDEARRLGARTVELSAGPDREAAVRLYRRLGFVPRDSTIFRYEPT